MTTLRRELKIKISDVLGKYLKDVIMTDHTAFALVDELADLFLSVSEKKPKIDLSKTDPAWAILAGEPVDTSDNILAKEATDAFESAFDGMTVPWSTNKEWTDFYDFVVRVYTQDKTERSRNGNIWTDYCLWRSNEGKYGHAMSNLAIRRRPREFMDTAWPTFLAHSAMYSNRKTHTTPDVDANGLPISY